MSLPLSLRSLFALAVLALFGLTAARAQQNVAPTGPLTPAEEQKKFKLPPGFEIQLVAAEPEIQKPMNLKFDHKGRLWVTHSIEYPWAVKEGEKARDALTVLEDKDNDGRFETHHRFADGLNIPIGHHPTKDGAIYYSIPNLYRGIDTDGDGKVDEQKKLFGPFGQDDTHGMNNGFTRWLDGWYYACHGFRNSSSVTASDGSKMSLNSGNTYRFAGDGSHIEQWTWGQVNPFGLCFDELGNFYTADCHSMPAYLLLRGGYYPSFGKPHDGLGEAPKLMQHDHKSTALCGIVSYQADLFPPEYRNTIFIGNVWTIKINHNRLEQHGSTYQAIEQPDFLSCDDHWFRPVDIQLGPDGALYIADFYNRIIGHYEVDLKHPGRDRERGRIWRIVYKGTDGKKEIPSRPDFTKADLNQLWKYTADMNQTVRTMATHEIVDRFGEKARGEIETKLAAETTPRQRLSALWILERIGGAPEAVVKRLAGDEDRLVRVHVARMIGERKDWAGDQGYLDGLATKLALDSDPFVRRFATEALGLHPASSHVPTLVQVWNEADKKDVFLIHTARMALRNQLLGQGVYEELGASADAGPLRDKLLDVSLGAKTPDSASYLWKQIAASQGNLPRFNELVAHAVRYLSQEQLPQLASWCAADERPTTTQQAELLRLIAKALQERGAPLPKEVRAAAAKLAKTLVSGEAGDRKQAAALLAKDLRLGEVFDDLHAIAIQTGANEDLRQAALESCVAAKPAESIATLEKFVATEKEPLKLRQRAIQLLCEQNLPAAREALLRQLSLAHYQLALEIALGMSKQNEAAQGMLALIEQGKAPRALLIDQNVRKNLVALKLPNIEPRIAKLTEGLPPPDAAIAQLLAARRKGFLAASTDVAAGKAIFMKQCAICHKLGQEGNKIGPELNGIGGRGVERILEDILDPSRNVDPLFRGATIEMNDGRVLTGLVLRQEEKTLVLADPQGKEVTLSLDAIANRTTSPLSAMPGNVAQQLPEAEFYQLVAFLLSQREK